MMKNSNKKMNSLFELSLPFQFRQPILVESNYMMQIMATTNPVKETNNNDIYNQILSKQR